VRQGEIATIAANRPSWLCTVPPTGEVDHKSPALHNASWEVIASAEGLLRDFESREVPCSPKRVPESGAPSVSCEVVRGALGHSGLRNG
jgi:hypothetical protein